MLALITVIGGLLLRGDLLAKPACREMVTGLVPRLNQRQPVRGHRDPGRDRDAAQSLPAFGAGADARKSARATRRKRAACRYNLIDSVVALNGALLVNAAILVMAAAVFFKRGIVVTEIQQAHLLLAPLLGTERGGRRCSPSRCCAPGQSSTLTGTMAGQIVMEGFLNFRMRPWLRRLVTRTLAVTPAALTICYAGEQGDLPAADPEPGDPEHAVAVRRDSADPLHQRPHSAWVRSPTAPGCESLAWTAAAIIVGLNMRLVWTTVGEWLAAAASGGRWCGWWRCRWHSCCSSCWVGDAGAVHAPLGTAAGRRRWCCPTPARPLAPLVYRRILVPLDHSGARPAGGDPRRRHGAHSTVPASTCSTWKKE